LYFRSQANFIRKLVAFSCSQISQSLSLRTQLIHDNDYEDVSQQNGSVVGYG
jgi:hypothetical protein